MEKENLMNNCGSMQHNKLTIYLADLSYSSRLMIGNTYVPLGIAYLASYANKKFNSRINIRLFKSLPELLEAAKDEKPSLVGFSQYYWNTELNHMAVRQLRAMYGKDIVITYGGPSIDSDPVALEAICRRLTNVDVVVTDEGEAGFTNIVEAMLNNSLLQHPIDGAAFLSEGSLVSGRSIGLETDLSALDSPYLNGSLDGFLNGSHMPLIQTSRICPYTCSFCVSGKNTGKLRAFPVEQVKSEIDYIAQKFKSFPNLLLTLSDDNFGILKRDVEIAKHIQQSSQQAGYPNKIYYYNDKKFGPYSKDVHDLIGHMGFHGLMLSLQTENPEALKAIRRKNMSDDRQTDSIAWGRARGMAISTELIFGLPMETLQSFLDIIDKCVRLNFDSIQCYNLIVFDGIELNRGDTIEKYELKTAFRHVSGSHMYYGDDFCSEYEEVVVSSNTFDYKDFLIIRSINLLLYAVTHMRMHKYFFNYLKELNVSFAKFAVDFFSLTSAASIKCSNKRQEFFNDFYHAVEDELFESPEELSKYFKGKLSQENESDKDCIKINPEFGSRMVQESSGWVSQHLYSILEKTLSEDVDRVSKLKMASLLIEIGGRERLAGESLLNRQFINTDVNVLAWKNDNYANSIADYQGIKGQITFTPSSKIAKVIKDLLVEDSGQANLQKALYRKLSQYEVYVDDLICELEFAPLQQKIRKYTHI
jgi:radical SAM superfamily enzyme YgiQ (UPF0313 family)